MRTVEELRHARAAAIFPSLSLSLDFPGGGQGFVVLANYGIGPAINVDVTIAYGEDGPCIRWTTPVLPPGREERFLAPDNTTGMSAMIERFGTIALTGSYEDAMGDEHAASGLVDVKELWDLNVQATHLLDTDYEKKMADELERIRREVEQLRLRRPLG
jgi:hypothetical protein